MIPRQAQLAFSNLVNELCAAGLRGCRLVLAIAPDFETDGLISSLQCDLPPVSSRILELEDEVAALKRELDEARAT